MTLIEMSSLSSELQLRSTISLQTKLKGKSSCYITYHVAFAFFTEIIALSNKKVLALEIKNKKATNAY